jgi:hypothetical protein
VNRPDRLHRRAAAWAGDAGDGHGDMGPRVVQRPFGHHPGHGLGHGTQVGDDLAGHAQEFLLGAVVVDDEAALEDVRSARDGADRRRHEAACAALGSDDAELALARFIDQQSGQGHDLEGKHRTSPGRKPWRDLTTARGRHASPSVGEIV